MLDCILATIIDSIPHILLVRSELANAPLRGLVYVPLPLIRPQSFFEQVGMEEMVVSFLGQAF